MWFLVSTEKQNFTIFAEKTYGTAMGMNPSFQSEDKFLGWDKDEWGWGINLVYLPQQAL